MERNFNILVFLRKGKINEHNEAPIHARIILSNSRVELSLRNKIDVDRWDNEKGKVKGTKEDARMINEMIDSFRYKVRKIYNRLVDDEEVFDAEIIKNIYLGRDKKNKTVVEQYNDVVRSMKERVGIDYTASTIEKYENSLKHVKEFMQHQYQVNDKLIRRLDYYFISSFEQYLKVNAKQCQSSVYKHIQRFRKTVTQAMMEGVIDRDPFIGFKTSKGKSERDFLSPDELRILEEKKFRSLRLMEVKDAFVFSCYTGIAYVDFASLSKNNIVIGIDGTKWINGHRQKTKTKYSVPLLPQAMSIIEKYKDHEKVKDENTLIPVISAQKTNSYLKEIAEICGINKNLTFHIARHTFATTVTLTNGVPIETVSKMLGHQSITTTQIYSKVVETKISEDMNKLRKKYS